MLGRAKQGKTERYYALRRHLAQSFDVFVHAPGQRGLVMIALTLPSHDLVFKVIRDRFGPPKNTTRAEVMEKYKWVFEHDRVGRLVDAQEYKQLRLPKSRFMPALLEELLTESGSVCRLDGDDVFPEQWLPFLGIPPDLLESFKARHGELLGPHWWKNAGVTPA